MIKLKMGPRIPRARPGDRWKYRELLCKRADTRQGTDARNWIHGEVLTASMFSVSTYQVKSWSAGERGENRIFRRMRKQIE